MSSSLLFRVNTPDVVQDTIDGEVVIVNLRTGNYYSLDKTGVEIWSLLVQAKTQSEIVEFVNQQYEGIPVDIEKSINHLFGELQKEAIIVPADPSTSLQSRADVNAAQPAPATKSLFTPPILQKYTDMQDLLLLDPIHEVTEKGWPNAVKEKT